MSGRCWVEYQCFMLCVNKGHFHRSICWLSIPSPTSTQGSEYSVHYHRRYRYRYRYRVLLPSVTRMHSSSMIVSDDEMTLLESFLQKNTITSSARNKRERSQEREIYEETLTLLQVMENDEEMECTTLHEKRSYDSSFMDTLMANTPHYPSKLSTKLRIFWRIGKKQSILWTQFVIQFSSTCYNSPHQQAQQCMTSIHRHRSRGLWICLILLSYCIWFMNRSDNVYSTSTPKIKVTASDSLAMRTYHEDPMDTITTIQQYSTNNQPIPLVQAPTILSEPTIDTTKPIYDNSKYLRHQHEPSLTINTAKLQQTPPLANGKTPKMVQQRLPKKAILVQKTTILDNPQEMVSPPPQETSPIGLPKPIGTFQNIKTFDTTIRQKQTPVHMKKHDVVLNNVVSQPTLFLEKSTTSSVSLLLGNQIHPQTEQQNKEQKGSNVLRVNDTKASAGRSNGTVMEQPQVDIWRPRKRGESKVPPMTLDDTLHPRFRPIPAGDLPK